MAAATTALAVAAVASSAYSGYKTASAAKKTAKHQQGQAARAQALEDGRLRNIRYGPGARFSPFLGDQLLKIFGSSMGGRGMDVNAARIAMGLGDQYGGLGPWYQGYDAYQNYMNGTWVSPNAPRYKPTEEQIAAMQARRAERGLGGGGMARDAMGGRAY